MKNLKRAIHQSILRSDLLSCPASLRYKGEPQYESFCPGVVSIVLVVIFSAIFVLKFSSVLELKKIDAQEYLSDNLESTQPIEDLFFAVGIHDLDIEQVEKYFEFKMTQVSYEPKANEIGSQKIQKDIKMELCTLQHWQQYNVDDMDQIWKRNKMNGLLCPDQPFSIYGVKTEDYYQYITLKMRGCSPSTIGCASASDRSVFMNDFIATKDYFKVKLFVKDAIISPTNQNPVSNYIENDILLTFSESTGSYANVKISDYDIETDVSVLPWNQYQKESGYYLERFQSSAVPTNNDRFLYVKFQKSSKAMNVERQYGKFDDMLSYVGGLFGILFMTVQFFMMSYNQYRYELSVGEVLFNYSEKGDQIKQEDFGFWNYLKYSLYDWMDFFGYPPQSWNQIKKIHETRTEACQQLDIRYLMRKIRYLENVTELLISADQRVCILLNELPSMKQIQKVRKISEFYNQSAEEGQIVSPQKEKEMSHQSLVGREISKRVIPQGNSSEKNQQIQDKGQHSIKYLDIPEVSADLNFMFEDNDSNDTIVNEVQSAYLRLGNKINDPMNQKILNRIPREMIRNLQSRHTSRSRKKSFESIDMEVIDLKPQSKKRVNTTKQIRRRHSKQ